MKKVKSSSQKTHRRHRKNGKQEPRIESTEDATCPTFRKAKEEDDGTVEEPLESSSSPIPKMHQLFVNL